MTATTDPAIRPALLPLAPADSGFVIVSAVAVVVADEGAIDVTGSAVVVADVDEVVIVALDVVVTLFVCCGTRLVYTA